MADVVAGAEAWSSQGGDTGALLLHGFTGNPVSLRPLGETLAAEGFAVELPRLPGHGTCWQDLQRTRASDWEREALAGLDLLRARTRRRIVVGQSFGGALALHLAASQPTAVDALVLVNPWLRTDAPWSRALATLKHLLPGASAAGTDFVDPWVRTRDPWSRALPVLKHVLPGTPGVGNDIALPGTDEKPYPIAPLKALHSVVRFQRRLDLSAVTAPLVVLTSRRDHVVASEDSRVVLDSVASAAREQVWLEHSFHVATLDHDAPVIAERTLRLLHQLRDKDLADA